MASQQVIDEFKTVYINMKNIDQVRLMRENIGVESLKNDSKFTEEYTEILKTIEFINEYRFDVHDAALSAMTGIYTQVLRRLRNQTDINNADYMSQKQGFLQALGVQLDQVRQNLFYFVSAAIIQKNILEDNGIQKEHNRSMAKLKEESKLLLEQLNKAAQDNLAEVKKHAEEIESRARKTAEKISVEDAQKQFRTAATDLNGKIKMWAGFSSLALLGFGGLAWYFMLNQNLPPKWDWQVLYYTTIRVTILTSLGAIATFCFHMLKSTYHLREVNLHRERLANSISAFVESAVTPEQRDLVLLQLVNAISDFGNTGLVGGEGEGTSKPGIGSISLGITPPKS
jgi:hypothetical protein